MDITKMSVTELKALAYDVAVDLQRAENNLKAINLQIETKAKEESEKESKPKK